MTAPPAAAGFAAVEDADGLVRVCLLARGRCRAGPEAGPAQRLGQLETVDRELQSKILGHLATFGPTL